MRSQESRDWYGIKMEAQNVQLFRERLSKNVHERYCGWFCVHSSSSRKFERMASEAMDVWLLVPKESRKSRFDSYSVLIISHITFRAFSK